MSGADRPKNRFFRIEEAFRQRRWQGEEEEFVGREEYVDPVWSFFGDEPLWEKLNTEFAKWNAFEQTVQDFQNFFAEHKQIRERKTKGA